MPILRSQPDIYPEGLFEGDGTEDDHDGRWWALYTMSRREKDLMRRLRQMEISYYGPLIPFKNRSPQGRVRTSHVPLFPGYVFLQGDEDDRCQALTTKCISRVLPVEDGRALFADLAQVWRMIASDTPLSPEARLQAGMRVRIRNGSLAGVEGVVIQRRGQDRLLVSIDFLQQGASVSLDDFCVERID